MSDTFHLRHAQVFCPIHGTVGLSAPEYHEQMIQMADAWRCPICDEIADFDHEFYAQTHDMPSLYCVDFFDDIPF